MMLIKFLEIRDKATCIPVIAIKMLADTEIQHKYLWRCGYPLDGSGIVLMKLEDQKATSDPCEWGGRTMPIAHEYILKNFNTLKDGDVIDVRIYLGEAKTPAAAEIISGLEKVF